MRTTRYPTKTAWILGPALFLSANMPEAQMTPDQERGMHVLRRTGFCAQLEDLSEVTASGSATQQQQISAYLVRQITGQGITENAETTNLVNAYMNLRGIPALGASSNPPAQAATTWTIDDLSELNLVYAMFSEFKLREVLVQEWQRTFNTHSGAAWGYFNTLFQRPPYNLTQSQAGAEANKYTAYFHWLQNDLIRTNATGTYHDLLTASANSLEMAAFLNGISSQAPDPDENHARELLELHSCGQLGSWIVGTGWIQLPNYYYSDIQAISRILSGYTYVDVSPSTPSFQPLFQPTVCSGSQTQSGHFTTCPTPGSNTLFGRPGINPLMIPITINEDPNTQSERDALLWHLANSPATAEFVARKLYRLFISQDDPPPGDPLIVQCMSVWGNQGGNIGAQVAVLLTSPAFLDDTTIRWNLARTQMGVLAQQVGLFHGRVYDGNDATSLVRMGNVRDWHEEYMGHPQFRVGSPEGESTDNRALLTTLRNLGSNRLRQELYSLFNAATYPFQAAGMTQTIGYDYLNELIPPLTFLSATELADYFTVAAFAGEQTNADYNQLLNFFTLTSTGAPGPTLATLFATNPPVYTDQMTSGLALIGGHTLNTLK